jgi:hypothetical protein
MDRSSFVGVEFDGESKDLRLFRKQLQARHTSEFSAKLLPIIFPLRRTIKA